MISPVLHLTVLLSAGFITAAPLKQASEVASPDSLPPASSLYNFAVDVSTVTTVNEFLCLKNLGYQVVFVQAYEPTSGGSVNKFAVSTVVNANSAGLASEVYVTPAIGSKSGQTEFDKAYKNLKDGGITVTSIWLQVTSPIDWNVKTQTNVNFIQSFVSRATANGVGVGIYTNWYDWQQITGGSTAFSKQRLWYWNALGRGTSAESIATFDDFRFFGGWVGAVAKQFGLNEYLCALNLNRDVYPNSSKDIKLKAEVKKGVLVAGGFV